MVVGDPISDKDHLDSILEGLLEEYNSVVMMIYGKVDPPYVSDVEA